MQLKYTKTSKIGSVKAIKDSFSPFGRIAWHFEYRDYEHDHGEKTFLGEKGKFNGEDIIDIIARQPATARFICQRLFQFFAGNIPQMQPIVTGQMSKGLPTASEGCITRRHIFILVSDAAFEMVKSTCKSDTPMDGRSDYIPGQMKWFKILNILTQYGNIYKL